MHPFLVWPEQQLCRCPTSRGGAWVALAGLGLPGINVLVFAALREWPAPAEPEGGLVVEVVAEPDGHAGAGFEPERFPRAPQGGQPGDGFCPTRRPCPARPTRSCPARRFAGS